MSTSATSTNIKRRLAAVLLGCFCAITTTVAHAHDAVVGGSPADSEVLASAPTTVTLEFSGEPKQGFNTMAISNSKGDVLVTGEPTVDGRNVTLAIPETTTLTPDEYTIGFQITSSDGHFTRGKTIFTIVNVKQGAGRLIRDEKDHGVFPLPFCECWRRCGARCSGRC